jgi:hypothetical protein
VWSPLAAAGSAALALIAAISSLVASASRKSGGVMLVRSARPLIHRA